MSTFVRTINNIQTGGRGRIDKIIYAKLADGADVIQAGYSA